MKWTITERLVTPFKYTHYTQIAEIDSNVDHVVLPLKQGEYLIQLWQADNFTIRASNTIIVHEDTSDVKVFQPKFA